MARSIAASRSRTLVLAADVVGMVFRTVGMYHRLHPDGLLCRAVKSSRDNWARTAVNGYFGSHRTTTNLWESILATCTPRAMYPFEHANFEWRRGGASVQPLAESH